MNSRLTQLAVLVTLAAVASMQAAQVLGAPANPSGAAVRLIPERDNGRSISELEARLLHDAGDGRWDEHTLFSAALIASGVETDEELRTATEEFAALATELRSAILHFESTQQRAATILAFLHRRVLSGEYDLQATELPQVLASGRFNCVSATVLYNSLADVAGLSVYAVRLPNHTCSVLVDGQRRIRVEATCGDWFEARERPRSLQDAATPGMVAARGTGDSAVLERPISDVALVAMIYYNRGVEALRHRRLEQAIALNRMALVLDAENADARGNLLAALNKQALLLAAKGQFSAAMEVVEEGLAIDPSHAPLRQNRALIDRSREKTANDVSRGTL